MEEFPSEEMVKQPLEETLSWHAKEVRVDPTLPQEVSCLSGESKRSARFSTHDPSSSSRSTIGDII